MISMHIQPEFDFDALQAGDGAANTLRSAIHQFFVNRSSADLGYLLLAAECIVTAVDDIAAGLAVAEAVLADPGLGSERRMQVRINDYLHAVDWLNCDEDDMPSITFQLACDYMQVSKLAMRAGIARFMKFDVTNGPRELLLVDKKVISAISKMPVLQKSGQGAGGGRSVSEARPVEAFAAQDALSLAFARMHKKCKR